MSFFALHCVFEAFNEIVVAGVLVSYKTHTPQSKDESKLQMTFTIILKFAKISRKALSSIKKRQQIKCPVE
jgi:hypothetical protein